MAAKKKLKRRSQKPNVLLGIPLNKEVAPFKRLTKTQAAHDQGHREGHTEGYSLGVKRTRAEEQRKQQVQMKANFTDLSGVWNQVAQYATKASEHAAASALYASNLSSMYKTVAETKSQEGDNS